MITVEFKEVGRNKLTWTQRFKRLDEDALTLAIKNKGVLMSRNVWCENGQIVAGSHVAGTYSVKET